TPNELTTAATPYVVTLTVTDGNGAKTTATQNIQVTHLQPVPAIEETSQTSANASIIGLSVVVPDPGNDDVFTYTVTLNGQPYIQPTTSGNHFNFTIPGNAGTVGIAVTVTDNEGGTGFASTTISVLAANTTKTLAAGDVTGINELLLLALGSNTIDASTL